MFFGHFQRYYGVIWLNVTNASANVVVLIHVLGCEEVAVMNSATLKDLKLAIKKKVNDVEESTMGHRHISWYVPNIGSMQWRHNPELNCRIIVKTLG